MAEGGDDLFSRLCYTLNYVLFPCVYNHFLSFKGFLLIPSSKMCRGKLLAKQGLFD